MEATSLDNSPRISHTAQKGSSPALMSTTVANTLSAPGRCSSSTYACTNVPGKVLLDDGG